MLGLVIAALLISGLSVVSARYLALPAILCIIPFTLIVIYSEYLRTTFLNRPVIKTQDSPEISDKARFGPGDPLRSLMRTLRSIRRGLYLILIFFSMLFYFMVTYETTEAHDFSLFYQIVAPAYLGILAIVIAFAILVIRRETQNTVTEHFRLAITGLVQMYVFFALVTLGGLLIGTEVSGDILTSRIELSEVFGSMDSALNISRLLVLQFSVLAFPAGLLYLYAMIRDFMSS